MQINPIPWVRLPETFSGTHHDPSKQLMQKMLCCNFWGWAITDRRLGQQTRLYTKTNALALFCIGLYAARHV